MEDDGKGGYRPVVILENKQSGLVVAINKDDNTVVAEVIGTNHFVAE